MSENKKHDTGMKVGIGISCVAIGALVVSLLAMFSKGFTDWNAKNWGDNITNVFKKDPTKEKVEELSADDTVVNSTYILPQSLSFNKNAAAKAVGEISTVSTSSIVEHELNIGKLNTFATGETVNKTVNVVANLKPVEAAYDSVEWTVNWSNMNSEWATGKTVSDYIGVVKGEGLNAALTCKAAFGEPVVVKVKVTKGEIAVADTCTCNFYKQLTNINLAFNADMSDNLLSAGQKFTYDITDVYSTGTKDLAPTSDYTKSFLSSAAINTVATITEDFDNYKTVNFDYDVFYGQTTKFTFVDSTIGNVNSGKGRNAINTIIGSTSGDFSFKVTKGEIISNTLTFDIDKETVIYPESVTIGDGSDIGF